MIKRLFPIVAFALTVTAAFGQGPRKISFRTICLDHVGQMTELSLPAGKAGEAATTVPLYTASFSQVIETVFPTNEAVFYPTGSVAAGEKPVIAAKATLAKSNRQLFVFIPAKPEAGKPTYDVRAYDDDTDVFKLGSVRAINLAPVPVRFVVSGATTPEIPATKHAIFPQSSKVDEYNMYPVVVEFLSGTGSWVKGYSASWKFSDGRRELVVTLVDGKFKQPLVKIFSDIPPWTEQP